MSLIFLVAFSLASHYISPRPYEYFPTMLKGVPRGLLLWKVLTKCSYVFVISVNSTYPIQLILLELAANAIN
jgi:hypothetical protein